MALETGTYISDLVSTNPTASDPKSQGDDHIRLLKSTIKATFPNVNAAATASDEELNILDGATLSTAELNILDGVTATTAEVNILAGATLTTTELNYVDGVTSAIQGQLDLKAPLASPTLTGTPLAPTATTGTSTTQIATTEFVANTAFSGQLPAQLGNAGKILRTNGTDAAWSYNLDSPVIQDSTDNTKQANLILSGITAGQNRNITIADENMTLFTPGLRLLSVVAASNSATVDVETTFSSTYDSYIIEVTGLTVQTNNVDLQMQMKIGGSYIATGTYNGVGDGIADYSTATEAKLCEGVPNGASNSLNMTMRIPNVSSTAFVKCVYYEGAIGTSTLADMNIGGVAMNTGTAALTGIRFKCSSGNIVAGSFKLFGIRKA